MRPRPSRTPLDEADAEAAAAQHKVDEANERREAVASDGQKLAADADTGPLISTT